MEKLMWPETMSALVRAKAIYQKISSLRDQLEAVVYQDKI